MQRSAPAATVALFLLVAGFYFAYAAGIPATARWVAFALPARVEARIGEQFEKTLDLDALSASGLSPQRQQEIEARFAQVARRAAPDVAYTLKLRGVQEDEVVNAFALPGGSIILLDGLVAATADDTEVVAVLAHELGHLAHKHGLRNFLQALGIGAVASAIWGDFAGMVSNVAVVVGALRYSRAFELEADAFAVTVLRANDLDARPLIAFLERVADRDPTAKGGVLPDVLSTHPPTRERIERLRRLLPPG
jgi:predicted Zn-dependent protease